MGKEIIRIQSIDAFRALTMLLMIFVNNLWTLKGVPVWLEHTQADQDGMGLSDVVFLAFLFIIGLSIPFAVDNRINKSESRLSILKHIIIRSFTLVLMGFFMVNIGAYEPCESCISRFWWQIMMTLAFFLIWIVYPKKQPPTKYIFIGFQILGITLLAFLVFMFSKTEAKYMTPSWWGILGLIGWTYLLCSAINLLTRSKIIYSIIALVVFSVFSMMAKSDAFNFLSNIKNVFIPLIDDGSLHVLVLGGIVASVLLKHFREKKSLIKLMTIYFAIGIFFLILGFVTHQFWIISKIYATPPWVYLCMGISFSFFAILLLIMDIWQITKWYTLIKPAGTFTLTCYCISEVASFTLPDYLSTGLIGLFKSMIFAFAVIFVTGLLARFGVKLKI